MSNTGKTKAQLTALRAFMKLRLHVGNVTEEEVLHLAQYTTWKVPDRTGDPVRLVLDWDALDFESPLARSAAINAVMGDLLKGRINAHPPQGWLNSGLPLSAIRLFLHQPVQLDSFDWGAYPTLSYRELVEEVYQETRAIIHKDFIVALIPDYVGHVPPFARAYQLLYSISREDSPWAIGSTLGLMVEMHDAVSNS